MRRATGPSESNLRQGANRWKVAYLMLVHRDPILLRRAIETPSYEDTTFFIHVDRKAGIRQFSGITGRNVFIGIDAMISRKEGRAAEPPQRVSGRQANAAK